MAPGSDEEARQSASRRRSGVTLPAREEGERLAQQRVVPAGHEVRRRVDLAVALTQRVARPPVVVPVVLDDAAEVVASAAFASTAVTRGRCRRNASWSSSPTGSVCIVRPMSVAKKSDTLQWIAPDTRWCPQLSCCDAIGTSALRCFERSGADTVCVNPGTTRRTSGLPVAPCLAADPLDGVVAVGDLAHVRIPRAVAVVSAAAVLRDDGVAGRDEGHHPAQVARIRVVVDVPDQQCREPFAGLGEPHVRPTARRRRASRRAG